MSQITRQFELYDLPSADLDRYESKVMGSESLLQVLDVIYNMFNDLMATVATRTAATQPDRTTSTKQPTKDIFSDSGEQQTREAENYYSLEKVLQKYEADIRNHIRIEQQLKIYTDSIQESLDEKDKQLKSSLKSKDREIETMRNEIDRLRERLDAMTRENEFMSKPLFEDVLPKRQKRIKTGTSLTKDHRLSNSVESVNPLKKKVREGSTEVRPASRHHKSKTTATVDRRPNNTGGTSQFNQSFERKVFGTLKPGKGFEKSLMVNFQDFLKMQKSRDHTTAANFSNIFRLKKKSTVEGGTSKQRATGFGGPTIRSHRTNEHPPPAAKKVIGDLFNRRKTSDNSFIRVNNTQNIK